MQRALFFVLISHGDIICIANDELDLIVVIATISRRTLDVGRAHHKGETILGHANVVVVVATRGAVESFSKVAVVISHVKAYAYAVADFKAVVSRDVISASRVKILAGGFVGLCVGKYPDATAKATKPNFGVHLAEIDLGFLVVVVVKVSHIPTDAACFKGESRIKVVLVGVHI